MKDITNLLDPPAGPVLEFPPAAAFAERLRGVADLIHRAAVYPDALTRSLALEVARRRADALAESLARPDPYDALGGRPTKPRPSRWPRTPRRREVPRPPVRRVRQLLIPLQRDEAP